MAAAARTASDAAPDPVVLDLDDLSDLEDEPPPVPGMPEPELPEPELPEPELPEPELPDPELPEPELPTMATRCPGNNSSCRPDSTSTDSGPWS